jgi:hypothetical protein
MGADTPRRRGCFERTIRTFGASGHNAVAFPVAFRQHRLINGIAPFLT